MVYDLELKFWKENKNAVLPVIAYKGTSACFDLLAIEDTIIPANKTAFVPNGLRVLIPEGWYIEFATRSSHGIKHNLKVHEGIIDAGYKGPLTIKIYNFGDKDVVIKKGTAAAQCKIHKVYKAKFTEISKAEFNLTKTIRGHKGFGSSDKK